MESDGASCGAAGGGGRGEVVFVGLAALAFWGGLAVTDAEFAFSARAERETQKNSRLV